MQQTFLAMAAIADAVLRLFAAALELHPSYFISTTDKPCSNMQVG
jgi:isopenicillin N synthase-like dioxygenase